MTWPKAASNPEVGTVQDPLLDTHLAVAQFQAAYGASDAVMMSLGMSKTTTTSSFFFCHQALFWRPSMSAYFDFYFERTPGGAQQRR